MSKKRELTEYESRVLEEIQSRPVATRQGLIFAIYGVFVKHSELASCWQDRRIREAIVRLRKAGYVIISDAGGGYRMAKDRAEVNAYISGQVARIKALRKNVTAIMRAYKAISQIDLPGEVE